MRLNPRQLQTVYLRRRLNGTDEEGNVITGYGEPIELQMVIQPAGGQVNAQTYGQRLAYIKTCLYVGNEIKEGKDETSGICVDVDKDAKKPDYKINAIRTWSDHLIVMIERDDA